MKGTKEQKGITLIALIITIVVLLILAAVAISSISNDGILHYAQNAADSWNKAQADEQGTLSGYVDWIKYATCSHTNTTQISTSINDEEHQIVTTCEDCETIISTTKKSHNLTCDADHWMGECQECGYITDVEMIEEYSANGDGTHTYFTSCGLCNYGLGCIDEDCSYQNGKCMYCNASEN